MAGDLKLTSRKRMIDGCHRQSSKTNKILVVNENFRDLGRYNKDVHVDPWRRGVARGRKQTQCGCQPIGSLRDCQSGALYRLPALRAPGKNRKDILEPRQNTGSSTDRLRRGKWVCIGSVWQDLPSRMIKLCSRASCRTSLRRSKVAVIPVGLHPYCAIRNSVKH